ncbi:MAG: nif-specific transcriptional activator NifA [Desulfobacterota bacterium]|nr:nif-specific transcriptional activator NifA [Thermodesulfobacteriota bacterium]MDW8002475.1 nif-specific transcriptional activator NifA [Deltaproteobacteria bacterium]
MEDLKRKNAELSALLEVSMILNSSFNLEDNILNALKTLSEHLDMERGTVTLLDKKTGELRIAVAYGLTKEQIARGKYKIGEGIVGRVVESGSPIIVPDIGKEPLFLNRTGARIQKDNISFLCVPIKIKNEILGVLSVDRIFQDTVALEEDLRVLEIVATLIGQAIKIYNAYEEERTEREHLFLELKAKHSIPNIISVSEKMEQVIRIALKVANTKTTVLVRGESGTGKELIARAIHYEGNRSKGPFVALNCAALPETLLEAELFGFEKGAFTGAHATKPGKFELANGGTIFLDEIGDVSQAIQVKLLRVIQEQTFERLGGTKPIKVDVRIIAATNRDLEKMVKEGKFREDLYWRLNVVPIFIPPLRERREDILPLVEHFLKKFRKEYGKDLKITNGALEILRAYSWPGNVRELENTIERIAVLSEDGLVTEEDIPSYIKEYIREEKKSIEEKTSSNESLISEIQGVERERIVEALKKTNFNKSKAARLLGITLRQITYKIEKYGINERV